MPAAWALTARSADLERLGQQFADRDVGGVVLTGPAGVGKSRLGDEALRAAAGRPTARAVGHTATRAIPLGALAHLLPTDLVQDVTVGEDDRASLFHRARLRFVEQAGGERLLMLVDDVDQLDDSSLSLLLPLTIERTVFLIATLRAGRPLPAVVDSLVKDGHLLIRELSPLTDDEVATLLHRVLDGPIEPRTVERLATVSEGNLQVLQEVVRRAEDQGALRNDAGVWRLDGLPLPARLEQLVESHLTEIDSRDREVLDVLAVAGALGVADLEAAYDVRALEELEARGFIEVAVDGRRARATLAHPLYGEVLRQQLTPLRQRRTMRQLAERLDVHGARRREDMTRLALWRLEAGGEVDARVLLGAGRLALVGRDSTLANRFAVAAADRGAAHDAARVAVEAARLDADADAVERAVAQVWDDPTLPDEHRAHLCRRLAATRFARGDLAGALAAVEEAAAVIAEPTALASVQAQRALMLANNGRPLDALAVLDLVADGGDARLRAELASARSIAESSVGGFAAALNAAHAGAAAQRELPAWLARGGLAGHLVNEAHVYAYSGRFREARHLLEGALAPAEAAGARAASMWFQLVLGEVERDSGYGTAALERFGAAARLADRAGQQAAMVWALVGVAQGHLILGDTTAAETALKEADAAGESPVATSHATRERTRAWLLAGQGDLLGARRLLEAVADDVRQDGIWIFEAAVRHDLVRFGDPSAAVDRLGALADIIEGPMIRAVVTHARAAADADLGAYARAIDQFEAMDAVVAAAEAAAEAAELHRRRGSERAAAAAERRMAQFVERSGGAKTPGLRRGRSVEPLTAREREVALLAAAGGSSRDIATQLFLSVRTVDTHLARVYRKLGVAGRDELGSALGSR